MTRYTKRGDAEHGAEAEQGSDARLRPPGFVAPKQLRSRDGPVVIDALHAVAIATAAVDVAMYRRPLAAHCWRPARSCNASELAAASDRGAV